MWFRHKFQFSPPLYKLAGKMLLEITLQDYPARGSMEGKTACSLHPSPYPLPISPSPSLYPLPGAPEWGRQTQSTHLLSSFGRSRHHLAARFLLDVLHGRLCTHIWGQIWLCCKIQSIWVIFRHPISILVNKIYECWNHYDPWQTPTQWHKACAEKVFLWFFHWNQV